MGHGTIQSKPLAGGATTTIATGIHIAASQSNVGPALWPVLPFPAGFMVHNGAVYWIASADTVRPADDAGNWTGGVGNSIMSATAGGQPKTILSPGMAPGPSPVSATDAAFPLEQPGQNPPLLSMAFSPDFSTIYFAAGTRFYSIPAAGATAAPKFVAFTQGPEHGIATAVAADATYLYYPAASSGNVEINKLGALCSEDAGPWSSMVGTDGEPVCPARIARSQGSLTYDTVVIRGNNLYWGNGSNVRQGDVAGAIGGGAAGSDYPSTAFSGNVTGFAIGTQYAYFAEDGYIEKGLSPSLSDGSNPNAIVVARGQPQPMQLALDGTHVYWTSANCDINSIADSPQ
jgi:hypothetical protein